MSPHRHPTLPVLPSRHAPRAWRGTGRAAGGREHANPRSGRGSQHRGVLPVRERGVHARGNAGSARFLFRSDPPCRPLTCWRACERCVGGWDDRARSVSGLKSARERSTASTPKMRGRNLCLGGLCTLLVVCTCHRSSAGQAPSRELNSGLHSGASGLSSAPGPGLGRQASPRIARAAWAAVLAACKRQELDRSLLRPAG